MPDVRTLPLAALTLLAAFGAGWGLSATGLPLGWLIGAMLLMTTASLLRWPVVQPTAALPYVKAGVGTLLGAAIPPEIADLVVAWWPSLLMMFGLLILGGAINYAGLRRLFGFPRIDALLCSMPGGISEMILLGDQAGADQRRVAIVQALRIALSILIVPMLAGLAFGISVESNATADDHAMSFADWGWLAVCIAAGIAADRWGRIPAALILVPMIVSAALHLGHVSLFKVPPEMSIVIQVMIGINVGARFLGVSVRMLAGFAFSAIAVVSVQIGIALTAAILLSSTGTWDGLALLLAFAPGGLAEMSLMALTMGREVAFVVCHHILRVLFALFAAPALVSRFSERPE